MRSLVPLDERTFTAIRMILRPSRRGLYCRPMNDRSYCDRLMDFDLSDDHELLRRTVRDFAEHEVAPVAEELDRTKSIPYDIIAKLGGLNLMGIPFPEEYGGAGGDTLAYALTVEDATAGVSPGGMPL